MKPHRISSWQRRQAWTGLALAGCLTVGVVGAAGGAASAGTPAPALLSRSASGTLSQWNWETEADDPGGHALMPVAISLFEKEYPNMKVTNREMTLDEQNTSLPLALDTSSSAPDLTETNEGFGSMGRLVTDGELANLAPYAKLYGWNKSVGALPLQYNEFTSNGDSFGSGNVYGVPWSAAPLGIFYNKALITKSGGKVPTNWTTFFNDLALAKKAGITPMAYGSGQPTADQPVHVLYTLADAFTPASTTIQFVFHQGKNPSIDVPGYIKAATTLQDWSKEGYFPSGYSGLSDTQALTDFTNGSSEFFIEGEWYISSVQQALGGKAGFWEPPSITGGPGEGYSIPTKSANPNAAAAFINVLLGPTIQADNLAQGEVPVVQPTNKVLDKYSPMIQAATRGWSSAVKSNQLVPYLDYATPNYLNQLLAAIQELQAGQTSPADMIKELQSDYTTYWSSK
jgi:raffinose/stachyose/melibiose transport system substrate-binding protein